MDSLETLNLELRTASADLFEKVESWFNALFLQIPNLVLALIIFVLAIFVSRFLSRTVRKVVGKYSSNKTIINLAANVVSVVFSIIIGLIILSIFNLDNAVNKFLATAGILGLAVGLALQDPLTNLFSGVLMSVRNMYNIGDIVETNGYFGTINTISLRSTVLTTPQGQFVTIPNKNVIQNPMVNFTFLGSRRVDLRCGVSYGEDLDRVKKVAEEAASQLEGLDKDRPVRCYFTEFGDSSINFVLQIWTDFKVQPDFLKFQSDAVIAIKRAFDREDILIPFPIRTLDFGIKGGVALNKMVGHIQD